MAKIWHSGTLSEVSGTSDSTQKSHLNLVFQLMCAFSPGYNLWHLILNITEWQGSEGTSGDHAVDPLNKQLTSLPFWDRAAEVAFTSRRFRGTPVQY